MGEQGSLLKQREREVSKLQKESTTQRQAVKEMSHALKSAESTAEHARSAVHPSLDSRGCQYCLQLTVLLSTQILRSKSESGLNVWGTRRNSGLSSELVIGVAIGKLFSDAIGGFSPRSFLEAEQTAMKANGGA